MAWTSDNEREDESRRTPFGSTVALISFMRLTYSFGKTAYGIRILPFASVTHVDMFACQGQVLVLGVKTFNKFTQTGCHADVTLGQ
ncbi:hypothetical protein ETB97_002095 [Aspergillus alliaceus]|uniref:Uncharacterized protein n=1 Tax=Petromyces alliaceus TaxID=209559 RepID=A0A8H6E5E5_PETAA|nr:hypothetical protein ETB97_002095 [Aspergillus burnettii]